MRKGHIVLLIVTVLCLISIAIFTFNFYDNNELNARYNPIILSGKPSSEIMKTECMQAVSMCFSRGLENRFALG